MIMQERYFDTELLDRAIGFAVRAHAGVERRGKGVAINITGEQDMQLFRAGVDYFRR